MIRARYGYDSLMVIADTLRNTEEQNNITVDRMQKGLPISRYYGVTGPNVFDIYNIPSSVKDQLAFKDGECVTYDKITRMMAVFAINRVNFFRFI